VWRRSGGRSLARATLFPTAPFAHNPYQHTHNTFNLHSNGALDEAKAEALEDLGFEWEEEEAEWLRWFLDLAR
jgi:hypothetical protein